MKLIQDPDVGGIYGRNVQPYHTSSIQKKAGFISVEAQRKWSAYGIPLKHFSIDYISKHLASLSLSIRVCLRGILITLSMYDILEI